MSDPQERGPQFDDRARARVISELEAVAWGDVQSTTDALDRALELALQATPDDAEAAIRAARGESVPAEFPNEGAGR